MAARWPDGSEQHWRWSVAGKLLASVSANPQGQSNGDQRRYTYNPLGQLLRVKTREILWPLLEQVG